MGITRWEKKMWIWGVARSALGLAAFLQLNKKGTALIQTQIIQTHGHPACLGAGLPKFKNVGGNKKQYPHLQRQSRHT